MSNIALTSTTLSGFLETDFQQFKDVIQDGGVNAIVLDVNQTGTTGVGATFRRDLASGSTDDYVVEIINDNAGDDQVVLKVQQDGTQYGIYAAKTLATDITYGVMNADNSSGGGNTSYSILSRYNSTLGTNHFYRHLASAATAGPVMFIHQDNAGDDQDALFVQQDGTDGEGITSRHYGSAGAAISAQAWDNEAYDNYANLVNMSSKATGVFSRNLDSLVTSISVVSILQTNALDDQPALNIQQNGAGDSGVKITHNNAAGYGLDITSIGANQYAALRSICTTTSGMAAAIEKNVASSTYPTLRVAQYHATGGQPVVELRQVDISEGFIDFVGTDTGAVATSTTNSNASVTVEVNGTKYKIPLFAV